MAVKKKTPIKKGASSILGVSGAKAKEVADTDSRYGTVNTKDPYGKSSVVVNKDGSRTVKSTLNKTQKDLQKKGEKVKKVASKGAGSVLDSWNKEYKSGFDVGEGVKMPTPRDYGDIGKVDNIDTSSFGNVDTLDSAALAGKQKVGPSSKDIIDGVGQTGKMDFSGAEWRGPSFDDTLSKANQYGDQYFSRYQQRMAPEFARQQSGLTESMINRGIATGSDPYQRSLQSLNEQQNRSMLEAANYSDQMGQQLAVQGGSLALQGLENQGNLMTGGVRTNQSGAQLGIQGAESDFNRLNTSLLNEGVWQNQGFNQGMANEKSLLDAERLRSDISMGNDLSRTTAMGQGFKEGMDVADLQTKINTSNYDKPLGAASILGNVATTTTPERTPTSATYTPPNYGSAALGYANIEQSGRNAAMNSAVGEVISPEELAGIETIGQESQQQGVQKTANTKIGSFNPKG